MPVKIFVSYRRDDDPNGAARIRDALAAKFGKSAVFMDVNDLLAGQRFDAELARALAVSNVLVAVIGPRWVALLKARTKAGERDYVREEIAGALQRNLIVIPVRVGREGMLPALPRDVDLPENIRDFVHFQKHDITHERFTRDVSALSEVISEVRKKTTTQSQPKNKMLIILGAITFALLILGALVSQKFGVDFRDRRIDSRSAEVRNVLPNPVYRDEYQPNPVYQYQHKPDAAGQFGADGKNSYKDVGGLVPAPQFEGGLVAAPQLKDKGGRFAPEDKFGSSHK